jgi:glyoxylase-like metal-dependent hydrolase (beta-lactamase superfamily II)
MTTPRQVTDLASVHLAPNPGPMTLDGTNSYVLRAGTGPAVVVDPGPDDDGHVQALAGESVALILITHQHLDHTAASQRLHEITGAPVRAPRPEDCHGGDPLSGGEHIAVGDLEIRVVATPGHTADSVSFFLPGDGPSGSVLTGDTVLGRGTTVVAHPDGSLGAYLESLGRLHALAAAHEIATIWPGHGPVIADALPALDHYLAHRKQRLDQVRDALRSLHADARDGVPLDHDQLPRRIVEIVYADVDEVLWPAAELSVRAQLAYLSGGRREM